MRDWDIGGWEEYKSGVISWFWPTPPSLAQWCRSFSGGCFLTWNIEYDVCRDEEEGFAEIFIHSLINFVGIRPLSPTFCFPHHCVCQMIPLLNPTIALCVWAFSVRPKASISRLHTLWVMHPCKFNCFYFIFLFLFFTISLYILSILLIYEHTCLIHVNS